MSTVSLILTESSKLTVLSPGWCCWPAWRMQTCDWWTSGMASHRSRDQLGDQWRKAWPAPRLWWTRSYCWAKKETKNSNGALTHRLDELALCRLVCECVNSLIGRVWWRTVRQTLSFQPVVWEGIPAYGLPVQTAHQSSDQRLARRPGNTFDSQPIHQPEPQETMYNSIYDEKCCTHFCICRKCKSLLLWHLHKPTWHIWRYATIRITIGNLNKLYYYLFDGTNVGESDHYNLVYN